MRVQTTAGQLRTGLRLFRGIIQRHNTVPVLGMVRFADGRLTGTDLDTELSVALPSVGRMEGAAAIDYSGLDALAGCLDRDVGLAIDESDRLASVTFDGSRYSMASCDASAFPDFGAVEGATTSCGNLGLVAAMRRVRFAMSSEETRYYLNGVALLAGPDGALLVATDGHRLAMVPLDVMPEGATGAIIPNHLVHWLCASKREPDQCVFSGIEPGSDKARPRVRFEFAGMALSAKLIDGKFPDIFRVIPRDPKPIFAVDRGNLLSALLRMRAFAAGRFRAIKLSGSADMLTVALVDKLEGREAEEQLPLDGGATVPFEAGYNVDYLISALASLRGDRATFAADTDQIGVGSVVNPLGSSPCLITCADDTLRIVQMPMRV